MADGDKTLPKKEAGLFNNLVEFHDQKQYKKGIKAADAILSKFPCHGQTLAMKGLILNCMDKKTEAYELVKLGIKNDIRSHITWHVLGLLHRSDRNYKEAIKCYKNAVRISPENQQILRDLSWMQAQLLDFEGFCETRRNILLQKPGLKQNWVAFAISHYLTGNYSESLNVLDKFFESVTEERTKYETSEILLFQNRCISKNGDVSKALDHLYSKESEICDKNALRVQAAEYLTYQKRFDESLDMWLSLLQDQPENYRIHAGVQVAALQLEESEAREMFNLKRLELPSTVLTLTEAQKGVLAALYGVGAAEGETPKIKQTRAARKILLTLQPTTEACRDALDSFMRKMLEEGVPSLCHDICALIMQPNPARPDRNIYVKEVADFRTNSVCVLALDLVSGYIANLRENGTFSPSGADTPVHDASSGPPTSLLWALFLRCHLLEMSGRYVEALADSEACVLHTPTALDMQVKKARILKRLGDVHAASAVVDQCRSLDLQDRYLNNKATKYFLRDNKVSEAMDTIAMFTKDEGTSDPNYALYDLQCVWYELECGEAYERLGQNGPALKKFYAVEKHFMDFIEDKFDFHSYCMRKGTLAAYLDLTQMLEAVLSHKNVQRATRGVLRIYLNILIASAAKTSSKGGDGDDTDKTEMTAAEKQKAKLKARKLKKKEAAESAPPAAAPDAKKGANAQAATQPKDEDPNGDKILEKDPAVEALRWCDFISKNLKSDPETQECACAIYLQCGKVAQAVQSLSAGLAIAPSHPGLVMWLARLSRVLEGLGQDSFPAIELDAAVAAEVRSEVSRLMNGQDTAAFVRQYCSSAVSSSSLLHSLTGARLSVLCGGADGASAAAQFFTATNAESKLVCLQGGYVSAKNVQLVHEFLVNDLKNEAVAEGFKQESLKLFPHMNYFGCGVDFKGMFEEQETC